MKLSLIIIFFINTLFLNVFIERTVFYNAISGSSIKEINNTINLLNKEKSSPINNAYLGALYMKKSSLIKIPKEKLKIFNKGKTLLENEIARQPYNMEMRFLRLIIQESCPKFLKYNTKINEDKKIIISSYSSAEKSLKAIIKDYSKTSQILAPGDFKQ